MRRSMKVKKMAAIILILAGIGFLYMSYYINTQVAEGRTEISGAQKNVDTTGTLFSINPASKEVGKHLTGYAQNKIDEGTQKADQYATYAKWLILSGFALIVIGVGVFFIARRKANY